MPWWDVLKYRLQRYVALYEGSVSFIEGFGPWPETLTEEFVTTLTDRVADFLSKREQIFREIDLANRKLLQCRDHLNGDQLKAEKYDHDLQAQTEWIERCVEVGRVVLEMVEKIRDETALQMERLRRERSWVDHFRGDQRNQMSGERLDRWL